MRQIRFAAIAFVGLVAAIASSFIDPGTFFNRTLSVALCSVLGLTSNLCYANLAKNSGDRAVAAIPPAEQTQNSFPRLDFSPYFQSTRPEFELPNSSPANLPTSAPQNVPGNSDRLPQVDRANPSQLTQPQPENSSLAGVWLYSLYVSPSDDEPFQRNLVKISQNGNEHIISLCEDNCGEIQPLQNDVASSTPKQESVTVISGNLSLETVDSTDGQDIWGRLRDLSSGEEVYFAMKRLATFASISADKKISETAREAPILLAMKKQVPSFPLFSAQYIPSKVQKGSLTIADAGKINNINNRRMYQPQFKAETSNIKSEPVNSQVKQSIENNKKKEQIQQATRQQVTREEYLRQLQGQKKTNERINEIMAERAGQQQVMNSQKIEELQRETTARRNQVILETEEAARRGNFPKVESPSDSSGVRGGGRRPNSPGVAPQPNIPRSNSGVTGSGTSNLTSSATRSNSGVTGSGTSNLTSNAARSGGRGFGNSLKSAAISAVPSLLQGDFTAARDAATQSLIYSGVEAGVGATFGRTGLALLTKANLVMSVLSIAALVSCSPLLDPEGQCEAIARDLATLTKYAFDQLIKATSWGEPHLVTFDGLKYDHHAVGEFILAKSTDGTFEIQVREASVPASAQVSLNSAVAMKVGNTRVAFYVKDFPDSDTTNPLRVDGKPTVIQGGSLSLPGGGTITQVNQGSYIVEWSTGERVGVKVDNFGSSALLDINPALPQTRQGQLIGLLGNFNGNPDDDLKSRDGKVLPPQSTINQVSQITQNLTNWVPIPLNQVESLFLEQLHKQFGDSWRISQQESLFDYAPGKNTESYTNRAFPNGFQVLRMLLPAQVQAAEAACRQAGVPSERLEGCLFDVGVTGNADFAKVAANALTNIVRDRVEQEIRDRIPVPGGIKIPGIRF
jgi:hypothetical protein